MVDSHLVSVMEVTKRLSRTSNHHCTAAAGVRWRQTALEAVCCPLPSALLPGDLASCKRAVMFICSFQWQQGEFVLDGGSEPMSHKEENDGSPAPARTGAAVTGRVWSLERAPNTGRSRMTNHNKLPARHSSLSLQIRDWTNAECWTVSAELWLSCHRGEASLSAVGISAAISLDKSALIEYSVPEHSWLVSPLPVPSRLNKLRR